MASLYRRSRSPFWWLSHIDASGRRRQRSTRLRFDSIAESRKARDLCREFSAEEERKHELPEAWECWVPRFLEQRYSGSPKSMARYLAAWKNIIAFLKERRCDVPRQLTRQAVRDYISWRASPHDATYAGAKNTALTELRFLGMVMREAVQSGFASVNPCERLGIGRDAAKRKPRISEAEHRQILDALADGPEWMRVSYLVAYEQGCRFSEAHVHLPTQVDVVRNIIAFRTKGQKSRLAEFPLSPQLLPLFARMIAEGREWSFEMPKAAATQWWRFFRRIGLSHLTFHCTRTTAITRMYEAGIPKDMVMKLVGHSSSAVHEIYPRVSATHSTIRAMRALLDASGGD